MNVRHLLIPALAIVGLATLTAAPADAQRRDRNKILAEEIAEQTDISNALDAVKRLRSNWLRVRASGSIGATAGDNMSTGKAEPAVYIDDARAPGGTDELKNVHVSEIIEMTYLSGSAALARHGNGHEYGAIFVKTKRRLP